MVHGPSRGGLLTTAVFVACAGGIRKAPGPLSVGPPASYSGVDGFTELPAIVLQRRDPPDPPLPWVMPAVRWSPDPLAEGNALVVWIDQPPGGRLPARVEAQLAEAPVHLIRRRGGWFGLAPLPIGSAGSRLLTVRFFLAPDSAVESLRVLTVRPRSYPAVRLRVGSRFTQPSAETLDRLARERVLIRSTVKHASTEWRAIGGFRWPRHTRITSPFGQRRLLNGELRTRHLGLDLAGQRGEPVRAAGGGRVALVGRFLLQGNAVYLDHGYGVYTGYFHMSRIEVREGDLVNRGQLLGRVGSTGRVTGPHLHWALYVDGESLDPTSVLKLHLPEAAELEGDRTGIQPAAVR